VSETYLVHNSLFVLIQVGSSFSCCDPYLTIEPNIYFLLDDFTCRAGEDEWKAEIANFDQEDLRNFAKGLIIGMGAYWTERFSAAALALGRDLSYRSSLGKNSLQGEYLSKFMYAVKAYDDQIYHKLSKLPGLIHNVKLLETIDVDKIDLLKKILNARNRVKLAYFRGNPEELTMLEEAREKKFVKDYGEIGGLFQV